MPTSSFRWNVIIISERFRVASVVGSPNVFSPKIWLMSLIVTSEVERDFDATNSVLLKSGLVLRSCLFKIRKAPVGTLLEESEVQSPWQAIGKSIPNNQFARNKRSCGIL